MRNLFSEKINGVKKVLFRILETCSNKDIKLTCLEKFRFCFWKRVAISVVFCRTPSNIVLRINDDTLGLLT